MGRTKRSVDTSTVLKAEQTLSTIKDGYVSIKLFAIINYSSMTASTVSQIFHINIRTFFRWVEQFNKYGVEGLRDKQKGHKPALLSEEAKKTMEEWIVTSQDSLGNQVHWTLKKLQQAIASEFGIGISRPTLSVNLKKMEIRQKRPRPTHVQGDKEKQADFKKNS